MNVMKNATKTNPSSQVYLKIKIPMITSTADVRNKTTVFAVCFLCNRILLIPKQKLKIGQIIKTEKPTALLIPKANTYNISNIISNMIHTFKYPNCFKCGNPFFAVTTQINGIRAFVKISHCLSLQSFSFLFLKLRFILFHQVPYSPPAHKCGQYLTASARCGKEHFADGRNLQLQNRKIFDLNKCSDNPYHQKNNNTDTYHNCPFLLACFL